MRDFTPPRSLTGWQLRRASQIVFNGGVIAYPTETVWGLGCRPDDLNAVRRILDIKGRDLGKGLILLGTDIDQFPIWIKPLTADQRAMVMGIGDRPTTWVIPASAMAPDWITGGRESLAIRISQHPAVRELCIRTGPVVSTSANRTGRPTIRSRLQCFKQFKNEVDLILPGSCPYSSLPSRIIDIITGTVIRD